MQFSFIDSIHKIQASEWDALCPPDYPFIRHAFLAALEDSQSTHIKNGWEISHLVCIDNQQLVAAMPGYIKHSAPYPSPNDWAANFTGSIAITQALTIFLSRLNSRKRKSIKKERQQVTNQGFQFSIKENTDITEEDLTIFYALYRNTYLKRSGHPGYLSLDFS